MVNITYKMHYSIGVIRFFIQNQWTFKSDNLINLYDKMTDSDKNEFNFDMKSIDWKAMANVSYFGNRRYLLKESDDNIPLAKKRMKRLGSFAIDYI